MKWLIKPKRFGRTAMDDARKRLDTRTPHYAKSVLDYVIRRFSASSGGLKKPWGWIYAGTPLNAISTSNWSPESAEGRLLSEEISLGGWFLVPRGTGLQLMQSTNQPEQKK